MSDKPEAIAFTTHEGGLWKAFRPGELQPPNVCHSILFEDGYIWDMVNGWRPERETDARMAKLREVLDAG